MAQFNILIRYSHRPELFKRCLESVKSQTYKDIKVFFSIEYKEGYDNIFRVVEEIDFNHSFEVMFVDADKKYPYFYNLYCNDLKSRVQEGWFMFLDTDDWLLNKWVIEHLIGSILEPYKAIIVQFNRNGRPKPNNALMRSKTIRSGHIGLPSIILHHSVKDLADVGGEGDSDYHFIKEITEKTETLFVPLEVVCTDRRSWGKNV